jgi:adenylyltransferase/sulfurtransferase
VDRYSRQARVAGVGADGVEKIRRATALVVGCGALGTHLADSLTRAGVGTLLLVDRDVVEWSNLQRQVLFDEQDAREGLPKAVAARDRLSAVNGDVRIEAFVADCSKAFLDGLPTRPDLVLDGTDNFATRYLLNDWCRAQGLPWIYAGATGAEGASMVITPDGACLRCLWPEPPAQADVGSCETAGALAPAIASVTAFQAAEALKLMVGAPTTRGVFTCDVWRGRYQVMPVGLGPAPDCPACARGEHPALSEDAVEAVSLCGRDAVQVLPPPGATIDLDALAATVRPAVTELEHNAHLLRFLADGVRFTVFPGGRALLFGVQDPLRARALYDRWLR